MKKRLEDERKKEIGEKVKSEFQLGISQFEELKFEPVLIMNEFEYSLFTVKEKKVLKAQAQIFGRDMMEKQIKLLRENDDNGNGGAYDSFEKL